MVLQTIKIGQTVYQSIIVNNLPEVFANNSNINYFLISGIIKNTNFAVNVVFVGGNQWIASIPSQTGTQTVKYTINPYVGIYFTNK